MSNISGTTRPEFDFWEFVTCARCHLAYQADSGTPDVPFWLTECGHIVCNNHLTALDADQSCAQCGEERIQLVPLQPNMDAPMSGWFLSMPHSIDSIANAVKFQQETMASLVRHHTQRNVKLVAKLRTESAEKRALKQEIDDLRSQIHEMQQFVDMRQPSDAINANGKRSLVEFHRSSGNSSSPRSIVTPLGPSRLTLPPNQDNPLFARSSTSQKVEAQLQQQQRPGSSRFVQQYAYNAPQSSHFQTQQLSHAQAAPARQLQDRNSMAMPPPPPPQNQTRAARGSANFKPSTVQRGQPQRAEQTQPTTSSRRQMGPPATPQIGSNHAAFGTSIAQHQAPQLRVPRASFIPNAEETRSVAKPSARANGLSNNNNQFMPPSTGFVPPTPTGGSKRFLGTPTAVPSSRPPRAYTTTSHNQSGQGGQRKPFVPSGEGAFG
ncbi:hypothetical protein FIBSPDRAFT_936841 [Athelia psychrophila]|uniref:RING-type domain-containing protein n=1 Tax=Athelia psychrophila TaxID=1759441 RepID=A0A166BFF7_9AGAM|nr:hypothetical protein FIBSPDRAFT_936841 [Fibularhizoctonia sp. CBS 109695]